MSHEVQNEILRMLADDVLRRLLVDVRSAECFSLMVDETRDCSQHEQLVVCLRYCDAELEIHEVFVGFHELERQDAETLLTIISDILLRYNLKLQNCRGQCYDGAANVAGAYRPRSTIWNYGRYLSTAQRIR